MNLFQNLSGANAKYLDRSSKQDQARYSMYGVTLLLVSTVSVVASYYIVYLVFTNTIVSLVISLGWGLLTYMILRLSMMSIQTKSGSIYQKFIYSLPHIVIAMAISSIISISVELRVFESEINRKFERSFLETLQEEKRPYQDRVNDLNEKLYVYRDSLVSLRMQGVGEAYKVFEHRVKMLEQERRQYERIIMGISNTVNDRSRFSLIERFDVLRDLRSNSRMYRYVSLSISLFFVFINVLPNILWILAPKGKYEQLLQRGLALANLRSKGIEPAESGGVVADSYQASILNENSVKLEGDVIKDEISFINHISAVKDFQFDEITIGESKSQKYLLYGLTIIFIGIFLYGGMLFLWLSIFKESGFQAYHVYGVVSTSLLFLFFEFLGSWFLRQHNKINDSIEKLRRLRQISDNKILSYLVVKELSENENHDPHISMLVDKINIEYTNSTPLFNIVGEKSFAKEAVDSINNLKFNK